MIQKVPAAVFKQIEHLFKTGVSAVVGVWHFRVIMVGAELTKQADFGFELACRIEDLQILQVLQIHDQAGEVVVPAGGGGGHARIRQVAGVPATRTCGVDVNLVLKTRFIDQPAHDTLRCGRAADVAHADKKQAEGWGHDAIEFEGESPAPAETQGRPEGVDAWVDVVAAAIGDVLKAGS